MKQFVIIGLNSFGSSIAEELSRLRVELIIADSDEGRIDAWKHRVQACYVVPEGDMATYREIVPERADACIVDLGDNIESSILLTHHLKKLGCGQIMVRAYSESHAEIVTALGATKVVFPDREAAKRIVPSLVNHGLVSYTPIGGGLAFAEIPVDDSVIGTSVRDCGLRNRHRLNIVAVRRSGAEHFEAVRADLTLESGMILLVSGGDEDIKAYAADEPGGRRRQGRGRGA